MPGPLEGLCPPEPGGLMALQARRGKAAAEAAAVRAQLRRLADQQRRGAGKRKREPHRLEVANCVARRVGGLPGAEAAAAYLRGRNPAEGPPAAAEAAAPAAAELPESPGPRSGGGALHPASERAEAAAEKFCRERALTAWVVDVNREKGLTPNSTHLWARWINPEPGAGMGEDASPAPGATLGRGARQWVRRWRRRWGIRWAAPRPGPRLDAATLREKAGLGTPRVRVGGARNGLQKRAPSGP